MLAAAIVGLTVQRPLAWLADHQGINVLLAILVFATAVHDRPGGAAPPGLGAWRSLLVALVVGITVLPALSWAVSRMVAAGPAAGRGAGRRARPVRDRLGRDHRDGGRRGRRLGRGA